MPSSPKPAGKRPPMLSDLPTNNREALGAIRDVLETHLTPSWDRLIDIYDILDQYAGEELWDASGHRKFLEKQGQTQ